MIYHGLQISLGLHLSTYELPRSCGAGRIGWAGPRITSFRGKYRQWILPRGWESGGKGVRVGCQDPRVLQISCFTISISLGKNITTSMTPELSYKLSPMIAKGKAINNSAGKQHKPGQSQLNDRSSIPRGNKPTRRIWSLPFLALPYMTMQPKHKPLLIRAGKTVSFWWGNETRRP